MKPGKLTIWMVASGAIVLFGAYFTKKTISYSEICPRCLQHVSGVERRVFGFTYSHTRRLVWADPRLMGNDGNPFSAPQFFQELAGHKCEHIFISQGKCVYTSGMVGCYGGNSQYHWRIEALEELCRLHQRVPDESLARRTYEFIDKAQPIGAVDVSADLFGLSDYLSLIVGTNDWDEVLALPQLTYTNAFFSEERLLQLLDQTNQTIRLNAFNRLVQYDDETLWKKMGQLLSDPQLESPIIRRITERRYLPLFGTMLRQMALESREQTPDTFKYWPYSQSIPMMQLLQELKEGEIQSLLERKDPYIDVFCFGAIAVQEKLQFLDQMVAILNERYSKQALIAIQELLAGPSPFNSRDPHIWNSSRTVPILTNAWNWVAKPSSRPMPESWQPLCTAFERVAKAYSEWEAASVVQAMSVCDPTKTRTWLLEELPRTTDPKRRACLLAGMGAVADPKFLPILEQLDASPSRPRRPDFPPQAICLDYALHRCRGIDLWRVEKNGEGKYVLIKPEAAITSR